MAERELAILLKARDMASGPVRRVSNEMRDLNSVAGRAGKGVGNAVLNLKRIGIGAAAGVAVGGIAAIKSGLDSLAERENVIAGTEAAIKAQGKAAQVSAGQIRNWSEELERATGAAVDDKAIQAAATSLIRFGTIGEKEFKRTLAAATDLGAGMKTGPEAGAKLLGKAMSDPIKGMTALRKAGIVLSASEEARVKKLVKGNKVQEAQGVILAAVEKRYKGAAAASAGPYTRALNLLADASEDAKMALAEGFLPILTRVSERLSTALADPKTITQIREVGKGLADGFDKALSAADKIPWGTIGDSMKLAGAGAKAAFDLFTGLPPWVQTAVITGWGLNKLSGGAVGGIIGELGKGLIKGVLGMNAGVVNINAAVVNGGGGLPGPAAGAPVAAAASGIGLGAVATAGAVGVTLIGGSALSLKEILNAANKNNELAASGLTAAEITAVKYFSGTPAYQQAALKHLGSAPSRADYESGVAKLNSALATTAAQQTARLVGASTRTKDDLTAVGLKQVAATNATRDKVESTRIANASNAAKLASATASSTAALRDKLEGNRIAVAAGANRMAAVSAAAGLVAKAGGLAAAAAINRKDLSVQTTFAPIIKTYVSVRETINTRTTYRQFQKTAL